ncbi:MAG: GatB/YqeY domain-containing protein [Gammaproteobacteria bacterium]|nr:MAG: GatB/YqeY domain-containing protein [Gammaproteobacteria bacterium]
MSLKETLSGHMKDAMRAKDRARLSSIRMLQAAIQRREVDERIELNNEQCLAVVEKLIKQSRDAAEQFEKAGRQELVDKENQDIAVWQAYLPEQLSEQEVDALIKQAISETGAASMKEMGKVMGWLKPKLQGKADMGQVSGKIKSALSA